MPAASGKLASPLFSFGVRSSAIALNASELLCLPLASLAEFVDRFASCCGDESAITVRTTRSSVLYF
jgi:hypothetical protein